MKKRKAFICAALSAGVLLTGCKGYEPQPFVDGIQLQSGGQTADIPASSEEPQTSSVQALALAEYPELSPYPLEENYTDENGQVDNDAFFDAYEKYSDDMKELRAASACLDGISFDIFRDSMQLYLSAADGGNVAYSPINMYMALSMLAETAGGNSRQQILTALGEDDMDTVRMQANALWRQCYNTTPLCAQHLASSLWLREDMEYNSETLSALAESYYASVYSGDMGSEEYSAALRAWLNEHTGGLLSDYVRDVSFSDDTLMGISSTVYYQAQWVSKFYNIEGGVFHSPEGDVEAGYLKRTYDNKYVYCGENYFALTESLEGGAVMYFILPDEDVSVEQLACDEELYRMLEDPNIAEQRMLKVYLSVPKFEVSSQLDLADGMKQLGITDIFSREAADFSPLAEIDGDIWLSEAEHAVCVSVDEDGCTAASYIDLMEAGDALPEDVEELHLTFDRPFMFVIQQGGLPLFCGVVNAL